MTLLRPTIATPHYALGRPFEAHFVAENQRAGFISPGAQCLDSVYLSMTNRAPMTNRCLALILWCFGGILEIIHCNYLQTLCCSVWSRLLATALQPRHCRMPYGLQWPAAQTLQDAIWPPVACSADTAGGHMASSGLQRRHCRRPYGMCNDVTIILHQGTPGILIQFTLLCLCPSTGE